MVPKPRWTQGNAECEDLGSSCDRSVEQAEGNIHLVDGAVLGFTKEFNFEIKPKYEQEGKIRLFFELESGFRL